MLAEQRRQLILDILEQESRIVAKDLAEKFQLSIDSIRRDLSIMEDQGLLKKTYGGAIPPTKVRTFPLPESMRYREGSPSQDEIAKLAVSYIKENETVFIGGAGIHYGMLKHLSRSMFFTVVTNSLKVAQTIREWDNIDSYIIGGKLHAQSGNLNDSLAIEQIQSFSFDVCFLTGAGLTEKGLSTATPDGASFARAVSKVSRKKIGLAPFDKIGIQKFASSVRLQDIDIVITDEEADQSFIQHMEAQGVQVLLAPPHNERNLTDEVPSDRTIPELAGQC
ncbi:DeoR/GlpR family DNA-binding transcription regulator [Paenibacillus sp. N1-5-1-14]|uniref:DeoR/GlpR family DNA-binding transcription regulator n=1 Tax=Paenibacillus radicibacter TaxID=2972488 RepID=UPI002158BDD2|nr:DeoR/GlpR family DNA-binding transcription regulator [Paenibacillus radicibacter]MCR8641835.1 DeoR/GlpR family DNA-binding transcription regulator [Paenibacillus radicibacter]